MALASASAFPPWLMGVSVYTGTRRRDTVALFPSGATEQNHCGACRLTQSSRLKVFCHTISWGSRVDIVRSDIFWHEKQPMVIACGEPAGAGFFVTLTQAALQSPQDQCISWSDMSSSPAERTPVTRPPLVR
jgi:hypothetical protein